MDLIQKTGPKKKRYSRTAGTKYLYVCQTKNDEDGPYHIPVKLSEDRRRGAEEKNASSVPRAKNSVDLPQIKQRATFSEQEARDFIVAKLRSATMKTSVQKKKRMDKL